MDLVANTVPQPTVPDADTLEGNISDRSLSFSSITASSPSPSSSNAIAETENKRKTDISWYGKRSIVNYNPPWPVCQYHPLSKRVKRQQRRPTPAQILDKLNNWRDYRSISIDGMNGTGKSTLARSMNRMYMKINIHCPDITSGSNYNRDPLRAVEYMMFHALYDTKEAFVVWDRCRYSNLIFYYIHYLMKVYGEEPMPGPDDERPIFYINNLALGTALFTTVSYMKEMCADPILFIVCSDLRLVMQALLSRGGANDVYNAKERNYQMAQYHVYQYFADLLDAPLLDLSVLFEDGHMTLDEIHMEVKRRVDIPHRLDQTTPQLPQRKESIMLHEFCDKHDDTMVYDYSTK